MPRNDPTEGHPAIRVLQVRARLSCSVSSGANAPLQLVVELYERRDSQWARLTSRQYPVSLDDALAGEGYTQAVQELATEARRNDGDPAQ